MKVTLWYFPPTRTSTLTLARTKTLHKFRKSSSSSTLELISGQSLTNWSSPLIPFLLEHRAWQHFSVSLAVSLPGYLTALQPIECEQKACTYRFLLSISFLLVTTRLRRWYSLGKEWAGPLNYLFKEEFALWSVTQFSFIWMRNVYIWTIMYIFFLVIAARIN